MGISFKFMGIGFKCWESLGIGFGVPGYRFWGTWVSVLALGFRFWGSLVSVLCPGVGVLVLAFGFYALWLMHLLGLCATVSALTVVAGAFWRPDEGGA